jgi:hypothetical protein
VVGLPLISSLVGYTPRHCRTGAEYQSSASSSWRRREPTLRQTLAGDSVVVRAVKRVGVAGNPVEDRLG